MPPAPLPNPVPHPKLPKKIYPPEFKQNAVQLITEIGRSYPEVANQFKCSEQSIRHWVKEHHAPLEPQKRTEILHATEQLRSVQKENARLKMENEFLKKAAAYFAKESM